MASIRLEHALKRDVVVWSPADHGAVGLYVAGIPLVSVVDMSSTCKLLSMRILGCEPEPPSMKVLGCDARTHFSDVDVWMIRFCVLLVAVGSDWTLLIADNRRLAVLMDVGLQIYCGRWKAFYMFPSDSRLGVNSAKKVVICQCPSPMS